MTRQLHKLYCVEYGYDRAEINGQVTHGDLWVDETGVVRWVPDVPPAGERLNEAGTVVAA